MLTCKEQGKDCESLGMWHGGRGWKKKTTGITTYTVNILQESHKRRGIQTICYPNHLHFIRILIANYLWAYRQQALSIWVMTFLTVTEKSH